ncbi:MAG: DNA gyrase inhibitor YacG [Terriglobia bacterium]
MRCPSCNRETSREANPYRPFCSERCKMIDLDNWLSGRYRISRPVNGEPAEAEDSPAGDGSESDGD